MVIQLPPGLRDTSQTPFPASPFLWLWEIEVENNPTPTPSSVVRLVAAEEEIALGVRTFYPFPIAQSAIEQSSEGNLPTLTLSVDNTGRWLMPYLDQVGGFLGNRARSWLVNRSAVSESDALRFTWHISSAEASAEAVTFRLEVPNPLLRRVPVDRFNPQTCRWVFGSVECGYIINAVAAFTTCGKTLADCIARGDDEDARRIPRRHPLRFGGFRGVPLARR